MTLDLVAPKRPMTVQDLMRHTSGLTYGFFGEGAVKKLYIEADLNAGIPTTPSSPTVLPNCRSSTSREPPGNTARQPTCWDG